MFKVIGQWPDIKEADIQSYEQMNSWAKMSPKAYNAYVSILKLLLPKQEEKGLGEAYRWRFDTLNLGMEHEEGLGELEQIRFVSAISKASGYYELGVLARMNLPRVITKDVCNDIVKLIEDKKPKSLENVQEILRLYGFDIAVTPTKEGKGSPRVTVGLNEREAYKITFSNRATSVELARCEKMDEAEICQSLPNYFRALALNVQKKKDEKNSDPLSGKYIY